MGYYPAMERELRSHGYPLRSLFNWRLPTLSWIIGGLPSDAAARGVLVVLSLCALLAWFVAANREVGSVPAAVMCVALLGILAWPSLGQAFRVTEAWAGVAIALSLAAGALRLPLLTVVAGMLALFVREQSIVYVLVALGLAWRERRRAEAIGWVAGLLAFAVFFAVHMVVVSHHQLPTDRLQTSGWVQFGGWWFVLKTALTNVWTISLPGPLIAVIWPLSLVGLFGWRTALGLRTAATVAAYVIAYAIVGLPYNYLWGLVYSGLVLPGILFAPAAVRDLADGALNRSRIS
jgi:hypothetical protein